MCESTAVLLKNGKKETIMEDVARMLFRDNGVDLMDIMGEKKEIPNVRIIEANLMNHEIILEEI